MSVDNAGEERARSSKRGRRVVLSVLLLFLIPLSVWVFRVMAPLGPTDQQLVDAVNRDDTAAVRALLARGADPNARSMPADLWEPPLNMAMQRVWLRVSSPGSRREPVLTAASSRGDAEIVTALLDKGANPDVLDADGFTPLVRAVAPWPNGRPALPTVRALLAHGARVNEGTGGSTALVYAAYEGTPAVATLLLQEGAGLNARDGHGNVILGAAHRRRVPGERRAMTSLLLHAGAKP